MVSDAARRFERHVVAYLLGPWAEVVVGRAGLRAGERVLDVACGTGVVARLAGREVGRSGAVIGVDLNAERLDLARVLAPPGAASFSWVESAAEALQVADGAVDVVLCQQGLQFFDDRPAALREMRRALVPGGRLVVSVWSSVPPYSAAVRAAVGEHLGRDVAASLTSSTSLQDPEELRALLVRAGFRAVRVVRSVLTVRCPLPEEGLLGQLGTSPAAEALDAASDEVRAALIADVARAVQPFVVGDEVVFPTEANVATATT